MFDTDRFIEECRAALGETDPRAAMREVVARAVADPGAVLRALGEPRVAGLGTIHHAPDLTILNLVWGPGMTLLPHDHRMVATIGLYGGREDNTFWRRGEGGRGLVRHGVKTGETGDVLSLGSEAIHSVHNPLERLTAALHVYNGDFFETPRSEWDPDTLEERAYSVESTRAAFEASNARLREQQGAE